MYFCTVVGEKIEAVFRLLGDGNEILSIQRVIIEKVKEEIPKIPLFTYKFQKSWVKFPLESSG